MANDGGTILALSGMDDDCCDASLQVAVPKDRSSRGSAAAAGDECIIGSNASDAAADVRSKDLLDIGWPCSCVS